MAEKKEHDHVAKEKKKYEKPNIEKHEPLSIVRGSGSVGGLYTECSLYYYY